MDSVVQRVIKENIKALDENIKEPGIVYLEIARVHVNEYCKDLEPWQIIAFTFGFTLLGVFLKQFLFKEQSLYERAKRSFFKNVKKIPFIKRKIDVEVKKTELGVEENMGKCFQGLEYFRELPKKGKSKEEIMGIVKEYQSRNGTVWDAGKVSGAVYDHDDELISLTSEIYKNYVTSNLLHPEVFKDARKMDAEVVRMCCTMFNGGSSTCGTTTSGGTESLMLACKAYRSWGLKRGITEPEMVVPITAHAGFDKGAHYFGIKIKHVQIDPKTCKVDLKAMKRAITNNTIMLVGSTPQYPHGVMDDIQGIAKLGLKYDIPVHVDACLGSFVVAHMKKAGYTIDPFDFEVDGVTSISCDTHKYGFTPKGSSVIMYRNKEYRKGQFFSQPNWPGGIYATVTFAGSRPGVLIAGAWATMIKIGEDGYIERTKKIIKVSKYIQEEIKKIDHIRLLGKPEVSVVAITSDDFNIYRLHDLLTARGWHLNALQFPSGIHICITMMHTKPGFAELFIKELKECVAEVMKDPKSKSGGVGVVYGMAQSIPDRTLVDDIVFGYLSALYSTRDTTKPYKNDLVPDFDPSAPGLAH